MKLSGRTMRVAVVIATLLASYLLVAPSAEAQGTLVTFQFTGAPEAYEVPAGVTEIEATAAAPRGAPPRSASTSKPRPCHRAGWAAARPRC